MKWLRGVLILAVLAFFAPARTAEACDCVRVPAPAKFGPKDVVFIGRIVEFRSLQYVELEVVEKFHGNLNRRVRIPTARSDCDYFLPPLVVKTGEQFLIYATILDDGTMAVSRCSDSGPLNEKARQIARLRNARL
jgi:hypothetical protein